MCALTSCGYFKHLDWMSEFAVVQVGDAGPRVQLCTCAPFKYKEAKL